MSFDMLFLLEKGVLKYYDEAMSGIPEKKAVRLDIFRFLSSRYKENTHFSGEKSKSPYIRT